MDILRWTIAVLFVAFSLYVAVGQFFAMAAASRRLRADPDASGYSLVPLVGGGVGAIGALIAPHDMVQRLWWVPLIVDPGCALMFGFGAAFAVGQFIRRFNGPPT
jgi:hypothetical protein